MRTALSSRRLLDLFLLNAFTEEWLQGEARLNCLGIFDTERSTRPISHRQKFLAYTLNSHLGSLFDTSS
jgi:hypothetical protein